MTVVSAKNNITKANNEGSPNKCDCETELNTNTLFTRNASIIASNDQTHNLKIEFIFCTFHVNWVSTVKLRSPKFVIMTVILADIENAISLVQECCFEVRKHAADFAHRFLESIVNFCCQS